MALNIKDESTDRLARELAELTGESITVAARLAIKERLTRIRAQRRAAPAAEELRAVIARGRGRSTLDDRSANEILGYDARGLPT